MAKTRIITEGILPSVMLVRFYSFCTLLSHAVDTIRPEDMLRDNETLVSSGGLFELGFFKDPSSGNGYMGIWFKSDMNRKAVWVNRENPVLDSSGVLQIRSDGNLVLTDRRQIYMIVNSGSLATSGNTSATLTDSGNLVLKGGDSIIWQSFDYPSDTYLPGMKLGWFGLKTDLPRIQVLVSWMNPQNPTRGDFTLGVDYKGATKLTVWRRDNVHMDTGFWDGRNFQFILKNSSNSFNFSYISNENEAYFTFSTIGSYVLSWLVMASMGHMDEYTMSNGQISLVSHSICEKLAKGNASECLTPMPSMCIEGDTFSVINGSMLTSMTMNGSYNMGFSDCEFMCQRNCSCTAFASVQDDQTGCQLYYGNKNDLLSIIRKDGGVIYVRGDTPSEHVNQVRSREDVSGNEGVTLLPLGTNMTPSSVATTAVELELGRQKDQELPFFSFSSIETATDYFATVNKLGEGGFGPVYKILMFDFLHGRTCLDYAAYYGHSDCLQTLRSAAHSSPVAASCCVSFVFDGRGFARFANIRDGNGAIPLHLAARQRRPECVHILLDIGAPVCASTSNYGYLGSTPLHLAARGCSLDCVRVLLAWGADRLQRDSFG
ncbi:hypothetical protein F0562_007199 [Nyssa sinensis]|uniref:Bulb-type lectin domain-containing protein n=1 Tax=Nyssa sinensis TaxID=561372 RepID=A0A5J5A3B5_9ASTE|nr:hypothetical protein F0562_007199 [Nyssa sinensis]